MDSTSEKTPSGEPYECRIETGVFLPTWPQTTLVVLLAGEKRLRVFTVSEIDDKGTGGPREILQEAAKAEGGN